VVADYTFRIDAQVDGEVSRLVVSGVIDEHADLTALKEVRGDVEVNLKGVRRINSFGVRAWIDAIRKIPQSTRLVFVQCPPPVIDQMNMVAGFLGHGELRSFFAPMTCEECDEQLEELFDVRKCRDQGGKLPLVPCPRCNRAMGLDDLEEQYLLFVRDHRN
jgi:ABC-type transporter Mla MlaB component